MAIEQYMGVFTHWGSAGDDGTRRDWGLYFPPPEHSTKIHCNLSYHVIVSGGGAEDRNEDIVEMGGASHYINHRDMIGACGRGDGGRDGDRGFIWREIL